MPIQLEFVFMDYAVYKIKFSLMEYLLMRQVISDIKPDSMRALLTNGTNSLL